MEGTGYMTPFFTQQRQDVSLAASTGPQLAPSEPLRLQPALLPAPSLWAALPARGLCCDGRRGRPLPCRFLPWAQLTCSGLSQARGTYLLSQP